MRPGRDPPLPDDIKILAPHETTGASNPDLVNVAHSSTLEALRVDEGGLCMRLDQEKIPEGAVPIICTQPSLGLTTVSNALKFRESLVRVDTVPPVSGSILPRATASAANAFDLLDSETPLALAVMSDDLHTCQMILRAGAKRMRMTQRGKPLCLLRIYRHNKVVPVDGDHQVQIEHQTLRECCFHTAPQVAVWCNNIKMLEILLRFGSGSDTSVV